MKKVFVVLLISSLVEVGCVVTPPLSEATGSAQSNIMIRDVVERVKCELSEAFDDKTKQPEFLWLASWAAHVDLTLTINDNAGISPSGSFTRYQQNAVNLDAGPSSFPATVSRGVVSQFFSVSAGASLSGQAVRTETVSFTIALDELKLWRQRLDIIESDPSFPLERKLCNFGFANGITGNLGLKEWVDSAFFPVEKLEHYPPNLGPLLPAGVHSASATKAPSASVAAPGNTGPKAAGVILTVKLALEQIKKWQDFLAGLSANTKPGSAAIDDGKTSIPNAQKLIGQMIKEKKQYNYVLVPYLKQRYSEVGYLIGQYSKDLTECLSIQSSLENILKNGSAWASTLNDLLKDKDESLKVEVALDDADLKLFNSDYRALQDQIAALEVDGNGKPTDDIAKNQYAVAVARCGAIVQEAKALPDKLPKQVDPPIDSVLHSLSFVINYGANITPSWTLLQWKGPGQNANFASAAGVRTHNLVISMGPRAGNPAIGSDPLRLIELQAIRSINQ